MADIPKIPLIGQKIASARKSRHLSQEELAFQVKISAKTLSRIENDLIYPQTDILYLICKILEITPNYLLDFDADDKNQKIVLLNQIIENAKEIQKSL